MREPARIILTATLLLCAQAAVLGREFFVAPPPLGNDGNAGSREAPFASFERARDRVRECWQQDGRDAEIFVYFRGGRYEMAAPVVFDARDSGRASYRAHDNEQPVFSGGAKVTGWTRGEDGVWFAEVGGDADFRQLWINGRRAVRARAPDAGKFFTLPWEKEADGLALQAGALKGARLRAGETEVSVLLAWMHKRLRVSRVYDDNGCTRAVINPLEWDAVCNQPQGDRLYKGRLFWLENARAFLDAPGEFFLDREKGVVHYLPRADEDMRTAEVIRPVAESLVRFDGDVSRPVRGVVFSGLTFCETGWTRPNRAGFVDVQANSLVPEDVAAKDGQYRHSQKKDRVPGAVHALAAENVTIEKCRFERLGGTAVLFESGSNVRIEGNVIRDVSGGGIELGNDAFAPLDARMIPDGCVISDNRISRVGEDYFGSVAILGYYTSRSLVAHNEISDCPYTAISWGWGWGKQAEPEGVGRNRIIGNRIRNIMRMVDDGGGVYLVGRQPESEVADNDIDGMNVRDVNAAIGGAIYPDQATQGFWIHDNVARRVVKWLHLWTDSIRGNVIRDNFSDTTAARNDGVDNVVETPVLIDGRDGAELPGRAREIIERAGPRRPTIRECR